MSEQTLEERVAALEKQVRELLAAQMGKKRTKDWRRTFGAFTGDEFMQEVFNEVHRVSMSARL